MNSSDSLKLHNIDSFCESDSFATQKAKQLGLKHSGFGYFINENGEIKAFSSNNGSRLIVLQEKDNRKTRAIKGPPTKVGTPRYYYSGADGEIHLVTKDYGGKRNWPLATSDQVKAHTASQSKKKALGSLAKGAIGKSVKKSTIKSPPKQDTQDHKSKSVKQKASNILNLEKPISPKALKREEIKQKFLNSMVGAILLDPDTGKGAGKYAMNREDLETYKGYLDGNKPEIPSYDVSDEDVDSVIDIVKNELGPKGYSTFISKMGRKGDPPKGMANVARARAVIQDYITKGGISAITGKFVPFSESQLDHRVSLDNGGYDGGGNWDWMEARFNQFKGALTDKAVMDKINKELAKSPEEEKLKTLQTQYKNFIRNSYKNYFRKHGHSSISKEDIIEASGEDGLSMLKAMSDAFEIPRYQEAGGLRASGRKAGGRFIGVPALKERIIKNLKLQSRNKIKGEDKILSDIVSQKKSKESEISMLKKKVSAAKKAKKLKSK